MNRSAILAAPLLAACATTGIRVESGLSSQPDAREIQAVSDGVRGVLGCHVEMENLPRCSGKKAEKIEEAEGLIRQYLTEDFVNELRAVTDTDEVKDSLGDMDRLSPWRENSAYWVLEELDRGGEPAYFCPNANVWTVERPHERLAASVSEYPWEGADNGAIVISDYAFGRTSDSCELAADLLAARLVSANGRYSDQMAYMAVVREDAVAPMSVEEFTIGAEDPWVTQVASAFLEECYAETGTQSFEGRKEAKRGARENRRQVRKGKMQRFWESLAFWK